MKTFNDYKDFALSELGYTDREADLYAAHRIIEDENRQVLNAQQGKVFRCNPEDDLWDGWDAA